MVGGRNALFGEWPWQVLIKEATWLGLFVKTKCGGVLIDAKWVLVSKTLAYVSNSKIVISIPSLLFCPLILPDSRPLPTWVSLHPIHHVLTDI